jgi:hypothetical protein
MFHADYKEIIPLILNYRSLEKLEEKPEEAKPENAFMEIAAKFVEKYGNSKGIDFQMRFLSIMQFIEHYQKSLAQDGLIQAVPGLDTQVPNELLELLLGSFKAPQSPSPYPSSTLHNQYHEFNYKKVLKAYKQSSQPS